MPSTIVDSGPLVAFFDRDDRHHREAVAWLEKARKPLVTNIAVVTEISYLLEFSVELQTGFLRWASGNLQIDDATERDLPRIADLMTKYADLPADFADASLIALAERLKLSRIATTDRDFTIYRTLGRKPLRNVFFVE